MQMEQFTERMEIHHECFFWKCRSTFSSSQALAAHMKKHKSSTYVCSQCRLAFLSKTDYIVHRTYNETHRQITKSKRENKHTETILQEVPGK